MTGSSSEPIYDELKKLANEYLAGRTQAIIEERDAALSEGRGMNPSFTDGLYHCAWDEQTEKVMNEFFKSKVSPFVQSYRDSILHAVAEYLAQNK